MSDEETAPLLVLRPGDWGLVVLGAKSPETLEHSAAEPVANGSAFRRDIQGLRAVAVLLVVANHAGIQQLGGGFVGVDVFFVISGFLITGLLLKEAQEGRGVSLANFYARRARRILPAATVVLLATVAGAMALLGDVRASEVGREALWSALFSVNWKFASDGTDYFASNLPPSPLQHYWSLAVEEQFYLIWPALFAVGLVVLGVSAKAQHKRMKRRGGRRRAVGPRRQLMLAGVVAVLGAASLVYSILATAASPNAAYFSTMTRVWELAIGAGIALIAGQLVKLPDAAKAAMSWMGLAGIVASAVLLADTAAFPGAVALLPVLSAAMVIVGGMGQPPTSAAAPLSIAPMRWVGDRSYSLYLWHWPVLVIATAYLGRDLNAVETAGLVAVALLATVATYAFVEYPIHNGRLRATRPTSLALWPASIAFVAIVSLVAIDAAKSVPALANPVDAFAVATTTPPADGTAAPTDDPAPPPDTVAGAVAAAVAAARSSTPIPSPLTPGLDLLREDTWEVAAPCAADTNQVETEICGYGPSDTARSMVIMGDSHAGMWVSALRVIAETSGWRLYYFVKGGCPTADLVQVGSGREGRQDTCRDWRDWALGQIANIAPDVVFLVDRGDKPIVAEDGSEIATGTPQHAQAWETAVASTVTTLKASAGRVVVFSETPVMDRDPVTCLGAANANQGTCLTRIGDGILQTAAAGQGGATAAGGEYFDVNHYLCADNVCPMIISDIIVYTDGQHLTRTYATALGETMKAELGLG